jgi:hypothetical protein
MPKNIVLDRVTAILIGVLLVLGFSLAVMVKFGPPVEKGHRAEKVRLNAEIDDLLRRTCVLYKRRVTEGTMEPNDPTFKECP